MTRKKYYKTLKKYEELVAEKQFNEAFFNEERLDKVQQILCRELNRFLRMQEIIMMDNFFNHNLYYDFTRAENEHQQVYELKSKIENGEIITQKDYNGTYLQEKFFGGRFTLAEMFLLVGVGVIVLVIISIN